MGATQPVLGVTAGLQDRVLTGIDPGMRGGGQAGNRRGNTHGRLFLPSSDPQAVRGLRPEWAGSGCSLFMQQHFIAQDHPSSPFTPVSHIPCVLPQGGTEELEEDSQCPLPTIPPEGLHSPLGSSLPNAGGHRWRRTTTVLDVSQAWNRFTLSAHPAWSQELLPGFLFL